MSALVLPQSSRVLIFVSVAAQSVALYEVGSWANGRLWLAILGILHQWLCRGCVYPGGSLRLRL